MNVNSPASAGNADQNEATSNGNRDTQSTKVKKKKKGDTIEKNMKRITLQNNIETEFIHNSFFSKIGNSFDIAEANHLFLNNLKSQCDYQELSFDSDCKIVPLYVVPMGSTRSSRSDDGGGGGDGGDGGFTGGGDTVFTSGSKKDDVELPTNLEQLATFDPFSENRVTTMDPVETMDPADAASGAKHPASPASDEEQSVLRFQHTVDQELLLTSQLCPSLHSFQFNNWHPGIVDKLQVCRPY